MLALCSSTPISVVQTVASIDDSSGGPSRSVTSLCDALANSGVSVSIVAQGQHRQDNPLIRPSSPKVNVVLASGFEIRRSLLCVPINFGSKLTDICLRSKARLIHDHGLWSMSNAIAGQVSRRLRVPLIVSPRGMVEPWALQRSKNKKRIAWFLFQRETLRQACAFVATAPQEAESIRALGLRQPIAVIPNGVFLPPAIPRPRDSSKVMRTILFLSRLHPKKGLLDLVQAWGKIRPAAWRVVVAGPDENGHLSEVQAVVKELKIEALFSFVGQVDGDEKIKLFSEADIFVLPTYSENFGIVIAEALAHGVPVLTTRAAPWADLVDNDCGWWVDTGVDALVAALKTALLTPKEELLAMGERGRLLVARQFCWEEIGESTHRFYRWLLFGGDRPHFVV